jgi:hypothetical protein
MLLELYFSLVIVFNVDADHALCNWGYKLKNLTRGNYERICLNK